MDMYIPQIITQDGKTITYDELKPMMFSRHVPKAYGLLELAHVAVAGLGGLGSNIAVMLARLGVGELLLVDHDIVEPSNLNRQHYGLSHLGMKKTDALKSQLEDINCFVNVKTADAFVNENNAVDLFKEYNIVCEAFDNPQSKAMLVSTLLSELPFVNIIAASGMAGVGSSNDIKTIQRIDRLYVCGDETSEPTTNGCGLMSPRVMICAAHQANMVLRLILGMGEA
jgi:sulfur carrier protein ThiS adenylyltransferase